MTLQSRGTVKRLGPWFHNLHLPDWRQTAPDYPLGDFPRFKWEELAPSLPESLDGWDALDVGCNAGYYSFQLAQRGARVVGIDSDEHYLTQARWARERFGLDDRVEFRQMGVYDLARTDEQFDLVLFMGVLYHLRYPLLALDIVTERVSGTLVFQTLTLPGDEQVEPPADLPIDERERLLEPGWPLMAFVENRMAGDPTNWWLANAAAVEAMLRSTGLRVVERPGHEIWICERQAVGEHREELDRATGRFRGSA